MRKVKHMFKKRKNSEKDMEEFLHSKKYFVAFIIESEGVKFGEFLSYGKEDKLFSVLRELVKRKHEAIRRHDSFSMYIKQGNAKAITVCKLV